MLLVVSWGRTIALRFTAHKFAQRASFSAVRVMTRRNYRNHVAEETALFRVLYNAQQAADTARARVWHTNSTIDCTLGRHDV
jgi:hypothetical protein